METWIAVIGTIAGAVVGGIIAAFISYREQQRQPKLLMLEKRIETYSQIYGALNRIATCLHQKCPPKDILACFQDYQSTVISGFVAQIG